MVLMSYWNDFVKKSIHWTSLRVGCVRAVLLLNFEFNQIRHVFV